MVRRTGAFIILVAIWAAVPLATGQEAASPPATTIHATTRVVVVDAIVTDNRSQPVPKLKPSDFTVLEDGKPQKIAFFSFESTAVEKPKPTLPPLRSGVYTNYPDYHPHDGPLVIMLMDSLNTPIAQTIFVRQQILKYLNDPKAVRAGTAVLALGNRLSVLQDFTTDQKLLLEAAKGFQGTRTAVDVQSPKIELPTTTAPGGGTGPVSVNTGVGSGIEARLGPSASESGGFAGLAESQKEFEKENAAQEQDVRVRATMSALRNISRAVSGYPGRKILLWFSGSFPLSLAMDERSDFRVYKSYRDEVRQISSMLSDANIAVYPVEAQGFSTASGLGDSTTPTHMAQSTQDSAPPTDLSNETFGRFNTQASLDKVARDTGGLVFRNTNDLNLAMQSAIKDSQTYYVLGYYPEKKNWDGKFHTLKVEVADKGLKVRSRTGYYAVDPTDWKKGSGDDDKHVISTDLNSLAATGVLFISHLVPPEKKGGETTVEILVDASSVSFGYGPAKGSASSGEGSGPGLGRGSSSGNSDSGSPSGFVYSSDLELQTAAFSPDGKVVKLEREQIQGDLRPQTYEQLSRHGIPVKMQLALKPGTYLLRVGVRDNRNGRVGTLDMPLKIEK
jgi:VWFA-related protein